MKTLNLIVMSLFLMTTAISFGQEKEMKDDRMPMHERQCMHMSCQHMGMGIAMQMGQQGMMMQHYMMMVEKLPDHHTYLDMSEEQTTQMVDIRARYHVEKAGLRAELVKNQLKMKELLKEDASSEDLREQMQRCSDNMNDLKIAAYEAVNEMMDVLSEEQKEMLHDMGKDCPEDCPMRMQMKKKQKMMRN